VTTTVAQMDAVLVGEFGGPEVLRPGRLPVPSTGPGQVRIATEAVGVGFAQTQMRANTFPGRFWRPGLPLVLGGDVVGHIVEVGEGVESWHVGERVAAFVLAGGYAQYVCAPAHSLIRVPGDLDAAEATVLAGTGPIATGLLDVAGLRAGERVLVHAAAGGVGHLAVQLARLAGAGQVIGTAGSPGKREFVEKLAADAVLDHADPNWPARARELTDGCGVDIVLDGVGGDLLAGDLAAMADGARLVFFGAAGGQSVQTLDVLSLTALRSVCGFTLSSWRTNQPEHYERETARLAAFLEGGRLRSVVHERLPLARADLAHELVARRDHPGRIVLVL
jgi:NADPH2:quinone reductase